MRSGRPGLKGLVVAALFFCLLLGLRAYSFRSYDRVLWNRGPDAYSAIFTEGTLQLLAIQNADGPTSNWSWETSVVSTVKVGHFYFGWNLSRQINLYLCDLLGDDVILKKPNHHAVAVAFGTESRRPERRGIQTIPAPPLPPRIINYMQFPVWPWIVLSGLWVVRRAWVFWRVRRLGRAFPVEVTPETRAGS